MCLPSQAVGSPISIPFFPSSLPGQQDFLLHAVTRLLRSCFISHMYGSATLCPSAASGSPLQQKFMTPANSLDVRSGGLPWVRRTASPDAVQLHIKEITPDIWSRSFRPARPSPQRHIAGLLFATYLGSTAYYLRTPHFWQCPCLVGVVLPSGNGARFTSEQRPEDQLVRHVRRTSNPRSSGSSVAAACGVPSDKLHPFGPVRRSGYILRELCERAQRMKSNISNIFTFCLKY